jgi:zinc transport system substrate-binding protein
MAAMLCVVLASCGKKETANPENKRVAVVTTLFPLYDFARNVGQDKADVTLLLPPGVEAHTFEPRPGDIVRINVADVFVYTGRFMEPWVDDLLKSIANKTLIVVDSSEGVRLIEGTDQHEEDEAAAQATHHHGGLDPHIWLDFSNAQKMVDTICAAMVKKDPQNKDFYIKNAGAYKLKLDNLDQEYRGALASCKYRTIIHAGHFAFGYLAKRYNLTFLSAYKGFTPDAEPTPKNMSELIEKTRQSGVKYVYYEELISPKVAKTLAEETGVGLLPLNGAHNVSKEAMARGDTFLSIMQRNLESLKKGLECR